MHFDILNVSRGPWTTKELQILLKNIIKELPREKLARLSSQSHTLSVHFLTLSEMKKMNLHLRKKNAPTDVLSLEYCPEVFSDPKGKRKSKDSKKKDAGNALLSHSFVSEIMLGEIFLCPEYLRRQAKSMRHPYSQESLYMLIHGILHVFGYDHERGGPQAKQMFELQNQVFLKMRNGNSRLKLVVANSARDC